jgi:hypothetical protein
MHIPDSVRNAFKWLRMVIDRNDLHDICVGDYVTIALSCENKKCDFVSLEDNVEVAFITFFAHLYLFFPFLLEINTYLKLTFLCH